MSDEVDKLLDRVIESEKQQALRYFRLHPLTPGAEKSGRVPIRRPVARLALPQFWVGCTAVALLILSFVFVWNQKRRQTEAGPQLRSIEQALASIRRSHQPPLRIDLPASSDDRNSSETAWKIQAVVCRLQIRQYATGDLNTAVFQTLSRVKSATEPSDDWNREDLRILDERIRQLTSTNAVDHVLTKAAGS